MLGDRSEDNTVMLINARLGRDASAKEERLENKVKASMRAVIAGNWLTSDDDLLFRCGVARALLDVGQDSEDGKILASSVNALRRLSAALAAMELGVGVDLVASLPGSPDGVVPLPQWWEEVKKEGGQ